MNLTVNRRKFIKTSATTSAGAAVLGAAARATPAASPNETIRVAVIGPGGRGTGLLKECISHGAKYNARVTAVCDIWNLRRQIAAKNVNAAYGKDPKVYRRLEQALDDKDIDAVIIATPDHQHAKMLEMAVKAGKDVYCEKPMGNVLSETNAALAAVKASDRIVQIGTQRRSFPKYRAALDVMKSNRIGDIVKVDVIWNAYSPYRWAKNQKELSAVKQKDVDWPAFLMGKSDRPFDARIFRSFRLFKDFSSGIVDQWMTHGIDAVHMLTGRPFPHSAVAHGGIYQWKDYRENPDTFTALLEYGEGDKRFLVNYSTSLINEHGRATHIMGTHGTVEVEDVWRTSGDGSRRRDAIKESEEIKDKPGVMHHMANWLDAVRHRNARRLYCDAEAGYGHSVACIMSVEAYWSGKRMVFEAKKRELAPG